MNRVAAGFLLICVAGFIGMVVSDRYELPERVASHFGTEGEPNAWMERTAFKKMMIGVGLGMPGFVIGVHFLIRLLPIRWLNIPNRAYWLKPANHRAMCEFLFSASLWMGSVFLIWQMLFYRLVVEANRKVPAELDNGLVVATSFLLLAFILVWVLVVIRRFYKLPREG